MTMQYDTANVPEPTVTMQYDAVESIRTGRFNTVWVTKGAFTAHARWLRKTARTLEVREPETQQPPPAEG